ncbi:MAG: elongation factor P [Tissierellia bacterium]|jgi:elongation factor P|nr:elongation factor P [Tissierellia bacterium]
MVSANDFRKGVTFEIDGQPYVVIDFQHVKPGKGAAFVRTTYRNIITGATREETFNPSDRFNKARIERKNMQYLYHDGTNYVFMDNETFDQLELTEEQVSEVIKYVRENDSVDVRFFLGKVIDVEAPNFVELEIVESEPGIRGDSASNITKKAVLETGAVVNVPLFINVGDTIKIDTRTGDYLSRK